MKVNSGDQARGNERQFALQQQKLARAKEQELKRLNENYENQVTETKVQGEQKVFEASTRVAKELDEVQQNKLHQLESYQKDLTDNSQLLDQHKQQLLNRHKQEQSAARTMHLDEMNRSHEEIQSKASELQDDLKTQMQQMQSDSDFQIAQQKVQQKYAVDQLDAQFEGKLYKKGSDQELIYREQEKAFDKVLAAQAQEQNQKLAQLKRMGSSNEESFTASQKAQQANQQKLYNARLQEAENLFKQRAQTQAKEQQKLLQDMRKRLDQELNRMVASYETKKQAIDQKAESSFYIGEQLAPTIKDELTHYIVALEVPAYEKENVRIYASDRDVKLHYHRRFDQESQDPVTSDTHITKRTESVTKKFKLPEIVDPKKIEQSYDNGVLSFKLMKK